MLQWYKKLYLGNNVKQREKWIRWKVEHKKYQKNIYLITYPSNPENLFDIIEAKQLLQKIVYDRCPKIIGLAEGYEEAVGLVQRMIEETYHMQGDVRVHAYLQKKEEEEQVEENHVTYPMDDD